jgi:hypothetical protein
MAKGIYEALPVHAVMYFFRNRRGELLEGVLHHDGQLTFVTLLGRTFDELRAELEAWGPGEGIEELDMVMVDVGNVPATIAGADQVRAKAKKMFGEMRHDLSMS